MISCLKVDTNCNYKLTNERKSNSIILNEKNYEWMPKSLKQVGEQEAILPYQFKNKIGFAKIQIK